MNIYEECHQKRLSGDRKGDNMKIKNLEINSIETWEKHELNNGGIDIHWSANTGFGCLRLIITKDGRLIADTEYMCGDRNKEFINLIFIELLDLLEVVG